MNKSIECKFIDTSYKMHNLILPKPGTVRFSIAETDKQCFRLFITTLDDDENFLNNKSSKTDQLVDIFNNYLFLNFSLSLC